MVRIVAETKSTVVMVTYVVDEALLLSDTVVTMTNGPAATIGDILRVDLPKPRDRLALATAARYGQCRQHLLKFLYKKHRREVA